MDLKACLFLIVGVALVVGRRCGPGRRCPRVNAFEDLIGQVGLAETQSVLVQILLGSDKQLSVPVSCGDVLVHQCRNARAFVVT